MKELTKLIADDMKPALGEQSQERLHMRQQRRKATWKVKWSRFV